MVLPIKHSRFNLTHFFIGVAISLGAGAVLSRLSNLPFWAGTLIAAVAMFLNSLFAGFEDRQPGGFLNPTEKDK